MLSSHLRTSITASAFSGTGIALRALAWSAWTHANRLTKSTCGHCKPVTLAARNPVASENAAMSAKWGGSAASNRCASSCVKKRMRRVGSLSILICGAVEPLPLVDALAQDRAQYFQRPIYHGIAAPLRKLGVGDPFD
jgi:hypothetical protein